MMTLGDLDKSTLQTFNRLTQFCQESCEIILKRLHWRIKMLRVQLKIEIFKLSFMYTFWLCPSTIDLFSRVMEYVEVISFLLLYLGTWSAFGNSCICCVCRKLRKTRRGMLVYSLVQTLHFLYDEPWIALICMQRYFMMNSNNSKLMPYLSLCNTDARAFKRQQVML